MKLRYIVALAAIASISSSLHALKLLSPEAQCQERGLKEGTAAWNACIKETTAENDRITKEFYGSLQQRPDASNAPEQEQPEINDANFAPFFGLRSRAPYGPNRRPMRPSSRRSSSTTY